MCGTRKSKNSGDVEKVEERWFTSLEEGEGRMEEYADEEQTALGWAVVGNSV